MSHEETLSHDGIFSFVLSRFPNSACFHNDPEEDPELVLNSYFSSRVWSIRASRDAREHLLSQRGHLGGLQGSR